MKITLLNIGNGFDLEIGLYSSVEHFVNWLQQKNSNQEQEFENFKQRFWPQNGFDSTDKKYFHELLTLEDWFLYEYVYNVNNYEKFDSNNIDKQRILFNDKPSNWYDVEALILKLVKESRLSLNQINFVEKKFTEFLLSKIQQQKTNKSNSNSFGSLGFNVNQLFKKINFDIGNNFNYILNFNYTSIKWDFYDEHTESKFIENNVHGTLRKKNIIFGISKEELSNDDKDKFQFCKTFRKLLLEDEIKELPEVVDVIAFYGHSLDNQDSNYFFAQFDKYDIYNDTTKRKVKLIFYEKKGIPIHDKVFNLLKRYEDRINNKNVIQRLQLENRLLIKKIC